MAVDDQYTVSLMHFDGNLNDESGKKWTANGGAATSTAQSKFGGGSLLLNNPSSLSEWLTTPAVSDFNFGTDDLTMEAWVNITRNTGTSGSPARIPIIGYSNDGNNFWYFGYTGDIISSNHYIMFGIFVDGSLVFETQGTIVNNLNTWKHFAVTRCGNTLSLFVNGILDVSKTITVSLPYDSTKFIGIGRRQDNSSEYMNGYVDEIRISKIARWTEPFTPPPIPYGPQNQGSIIGGIM